MSARRELLSTSCLFQSHRIGAIGKIFNWDEHWNYFLFSPNKPELRLPPDQLLEEAACFSHGEQILIQIALDIWCEQGKTRFTDLIEVLDEDSLLRVISAILHYRELTLENLCDHMVQIDEG